MLPVAEHMLSFRSGDQMNMCSSNSLQDIWETCHCLKLLIDFLEILLSPWECCIILITVLRTRYNAGKMQSMKSKLQKPQRITKGCTFSFVRCGAAPLVNQVARIM